MESTSRSSTSSSERVSTRGLVASLLLCLALTGLAEAGARRFMGRTAYYKNYWQKAAAQKWQPYLEQTQRGQAPDILVVGDSSGAWGIDPAALTEAVGGRWTAYNLAIAGNYPFGLRADTIPLLAPGRPAPRVVLACGLPAEVLAPGVRPNEAAIAATPLATQLQGKRHFSDVLYLTAVRSWQKNRRGGGKLSAQGFEPNNKPFSAAPPPSEETSWLAAERVNPERIEVYRELAEAAHARGTRLVVVIPPHLYSVPCWYDYEQTRRLFVEALRPLADQGRLVLLDASREPALDQSHFTDLDHLNGRGAAVFSRFLGQWLVTHQADGSPR